MKTPLTFALLALSIAANAALIVKLRAPAAASPEAAPRSETAAAAAAAASARAAAERARASGTDGDGASSTPRATIAGVNWASLTAGGDPREFVARMRAAGFPSSVVHAATYALINEMYGAERLKLYEQVKHEYWSQTGAMGDPALMSARREINRRQTQLFRDLLGSESIRETPFGPLINYRQYGGLSQAKIEEVQQIMQDYSDISAKIRADSRGVLLRDDREQLAYLEAERQNDIAQVLTPSEFDDYVMRSSPTGMTLRNQLASLEPTEQEFRAIFQLQREFDAKYGSTGTVARDAAGLRQRREDEQKLIADVKAAIGTERGAEYERSRDYSYQRLADTVKRHELPKETAVHVWNVRQEVEQKAGAIRSQEGLSAEQRTQQLAALHQEATAKVTGALGERAFTAYKDSAFWLNNLVPPPPRSTPAPAK